MDFKKLRDAIANFNIPDPNLLAGSALRKLAASYDAYPLNHENQSYCVLLPQKLQPKKAAGYAELQAARTIIVLTKQQTKWLKVWPSEDLFRAAKEAEAAEMRQRAEAAQREKDNKTVIVIEDESA